MINNVRDEVVYQIDDVVMLRTDNKMFHLMLGRVVEPTEYGAEVEVESHSYPHRKQWRLRCLHSELVYIGTLVDKDRSSIKTDNVVYNDGHRSVSNEIAQHKPEFVSGTRPVLSGWIIPETTGELCKCGGYLVRTGTCMTCQSCGSSSGGCS